MSIIDEIRSAMVAAMNAGDNERKAALSFLLSSLKNKAIDKRADLTEEEEGQVILKEIKQLKETIDMTHEERTDLIEKAQILEALKEIKDRETLQRVCRYMEALVAYFKFYGGKD